MSTVTQTICDVKGCDKDAFHKQKTVSVRFTTEQNEGRSVEPYLEGFRLDFCKVHYQMYIDSLSLNGSGAMGYNDFVFREPVKRNYEEFENERS